MTGTAKTEEQEFQKIYGLDVIVIPTNKPMIRIDYPDVIYKTKRAKYKAAVAEIEECHKSAARYWLAQLPSHSPKNFPQCSNAAA